MNKRMASRVPVSVWLGNVRPTYGERLFGRMVMFARIQAGRVRSLKAIRLGGTKALGY